MQLVNSDPVMKNYDFLKKRNICCWGSIFLALLFVLVTALVFLIVEVFTLSRNRPDPYSTDSTFSSTLSDLVFTVVDFYPIFVIIMVFVTPRVFNREEVWYVFYYFLSEVGKCTLLFIWFIPLSIEHT